MTDAKDVELENMTSDVNDVIGRLNSSTLEPDRDIEYEEEETNLSSASTSESNSLARTPSTTSSQKQLVTQDKDNTANGISSDAKKNGNKEISRKGSSSSNHDNNNTTAISKTRSTSRKSSTDGIMSKVMNPFTMFKKKVQKDKEQEEKAARFERMLAAVHVESLPQLFVTKYIGFKLTKGLYGIKYTRQVAEDLISEIGDKQKQNELPLAQLHISVRGIHISEHKENAIKNKLGDMGLLPLEFISYGVQDIRYTRVFTFIIVRELSSRKRKLECHAYLCDSSITCRKLALSVSLAFQEYAKTLKDKPHKFQVDLRSMKEIDHELVKETTEEVNNSSSNMPSNNVVATEEFDA